MYLLSLVYQIQQYVDGDTSITCILHSFLIIDFSSLFTLYFCIRMTTVELKKKNLFLVHFAPCHLTSSTTVTNSNLDSSHLISFHLIATFQIAP